jgi:hypothetical protein
VVVLERNGPETVLSPSSDSVIRNATTQLNKDRDAIKIHSGGRQLVTGFQKGLREYTITAGKLPITCLRVLTPQN